MTPACVEAENTDKLSAAHMGGEARRAELCCISSLPVVYICLAQKSIANERKQE